MYYELYIDVLFLINFMMDSLLLLTVNQMLKCSTTHGRIYLGGALGAGLTCGVIAIPMPAIIKFVTFHAVINTIMIKAGLRIKGKKQFFKAFGLLYIASFLFGGILQALRPYVRIGSLFFAAAVGSYYLIKGIWKFLIGQKELQKKICEITLYTSAGEQKVKALIDTGNGLKDSVSKEPVSVVDKALAKSILTEEDIKNGFRYIPYRTVGRESIMPVFRIRKMCVHLEEDRWVENPVLGVCEECVSEQEEYQMILNPDILGGI
ncbi:sigma-E processing peptidase SpoIIGA [Muricomes intestini]|uniref:Stage II sporulation protein GA (Sporulation sigma-E factor processing peptidase) n=1 Tax=Muricomes intestini TaxID=1796634 RepID=A0A4V2URA2_9FIRM|nr:sigma-E processing peptidase SpoIIGA [Muricomes intestini]TCS76664.1 stage II sporulation protein GA (sporulation sigma-E factor processing peptidase) [Muricomes intestini]HAX50772.1 sigma-E processing peptidase SpoIIGA [Lachnospiraceae bacterium]HCR82855.1 sigma-E processing peptidase SpoIIGA [Lachnospiraceae bacterium]